MKIVVWWCEVCEVHVPLRDNGATVRKCTGGHLDMADTSGRRQLPDHWPTPMVVSGELAGLRDVDEDVTGWAEIRGHGVSLAESASRAAEERARLRSAGYRYLEVGSRVSDAPGGVQGVG